MVGSLPKPSKAWRKKAERYKKFAEDWRSCCDFTEEAAAAFYSYESTGKPRVRYHELQPNGLYNGFAVGKHWMDVTLAMWEEDLDGQWPPLLTRYELEKSRE